MSRPHRRSIKMPDGSRVDLDDLGGSPTGGGRGFHGKTGRRRRRRRFGPPGTALSHATGVRHRRMIAGLIGVIVGLVFLLLVESWLLL